MILGPDAEHPGKQMWMRETAGKGGKKLQAVSWKMSASMYEPARING